ncbi:hypothetical protein Tco_1533114 [Tanacetum coccineum]
MASIEWKYDQEILWYQGLLGSKLKEDIYRLYRGQNRCTLEKVRRTWAMSVTGINAGEGLESVSIRRIQVIGYGVLEFLGVRTTFDIFQNILFPYSLNTAYCLSWIRRIGLVSFMVFGECRHGYAVSSLMDTVYWLSE